MAALTGIVAAGFAGLRNLRGDKFKREVEASAALLTGQAAMVTALQGEVDRLRSDMAEDRKAATAERAECLAERNRLLTEHRAEMTRLREEHRAELATAYERVDELSAKVYLLQNRPTETRERRGDKR